MKRTIVFVHLLQIDGSSNWTRCCLQLSCPHPVQRQSAGATHLSGMP
jgi:hypothetical protein